MLFSIQPFIPKTLENRAALRTAVATLTAVLLAFALHLDKPYWAGMTTLVVANLYTGSIIDKALMRIAGTIIGAWLGYFIAGFIVNSFFLYLVLNFFIVVAAVYYYNFSQYGYAYLLGALGAFIVISEIAITPDDAFLVAVWRPVEIGLGVLVSAASAFCVFPNAIQDVVTDEVNDIFSALQNLLDKFNNLIVNNDIDLIPQLQKDILQLKKSVRKATDMIGFMRKEVGYSHSKIDHFRFFLDSVYSISRLLSYYLASTQFNNEQQIPAPYRLSITHFFEIAQQDLITLKKMFFADGGKALLKISDAMAEIDNHMSEFSLLTGQTQKNLFLAHFLRQISKRLINLNDVLVLGKGPNQSKKLISNQQQLRQDPDIIIHSVKAGLAAIFALVFWLISNWPGGLNGIVSSILISIRRNLFDMKNIGAHRLLGCMLGGGVVFSVLFFFSLNLYLFIIILFLSVWAFSLFSFKNVNYAYIGLQASMALVIAMAQEGGPPVNLTAPLERLGGVVIGIIASFIVANLLWRTDLLTMLLRQLQKVKISLLHNVKELLFQKKNSRLYDLTNSLWLCRGLLDSLANNNFKPFKQRQLENAKIEHQSLVQMQVILTNMHNSIDQEMAAKTAELFNLDLSSFEKKIISSLGVSDYKERSCLKKQLKDAITEVFVNEQQSKIPLLEMENFTAYLQSLGQLAALEI